MKSKSKESKKVQENEKKLFDGLVEMGTEKFSKLKVKTKENLDVNGDGVVDITDIIYLALKIPGIAVDREEYFKSTFKKYYEYDIIQKAINGTPREANMDAVTIEKIADDTIEFERKCATGASVALGLPGGIALAATLPTDVIQYFGFLIRAAQKLMYLYGFGNIGIKDGEEKISDEAMNTLISCLGVMFGVQGADMAIHSAALIWIKGAQSAIAKTTFKLAKPITTSLGKVLAGFLVKGGAKVIPLLGGVISGGLTYATFKPCCDKLRKSLRSLDIRKVDSKKV